MLQTEKKHVNFVRNGLMIRNVIDKIKRAISTNRTYFIALAIAFKYPVKSRSNILSIASWKKMNESEIMQISKIANIRFDIQGFIVSVCFVFLFLIYLSDSSCKFSCDIKVSS